MNVWLLSLEIVVTAGLPLLQTKLLRPRVTRAIIARPHLWAMLDRGLDKPLTLVCAGAGFGKTTLVSSWLEQTAASNTAGLPLPVAWLSLDANDNDLVTFLRYVIAALRTLEDEACVDTLSLLRSLQQPPSGLLLATFLNDTVRLSRRVTLVLEDYSVIHDPEIHEFVTKLIRAALPQLHLLLVARQSPALPLSQLRAYDAITEIRSQELRFSHEESAAYFSRALCEPLAHAELEILEQQAEGWAAGLKLAVLSLRNDLLTSSALRAEAVATDASIAEFLANEVLASQPPAVQAFLLQSAVVDHFCASLCEALLDDKTPEWDAHTCIQWLVRSDLFIISLSAQQEWFRYHHLFLGMLRQRLAATYAPAAVRELHRRAAAWYRGQGLVDEAIHHALAAEDNWLASEIMWQALPTVLNHEDRVTLERWLGLLPAAFVQEQPELLLIKAWSQQFRWQLRTLADTLQAIEALIGRMDPAAELPDRLHAIQAQMAIFYGQAAFQSNHPHQALPLLQRALNLLPAAAAYLRGGAALYLGISMQASGLFPEAERLLLEQYERYADKRDGFSLRLCLSLCFVYLAEGKLEQVRQTALDMLTQARAAGLITQQCWAHYFLGLVLYQWNDLPAARGHFAAVLEHRYLANMAVVRAGMSQLALLHQLDGDAPAADRILDLLAELDLEHQGREDASTRAMRAWLQLLQGDAGAAARWAEAFAAPVVDSPLLWLATPHVIKARILLARGDEADLAEASALLDELLAMAVRTHNLRAEIELLALSAAVAQQQNQYQGALAQLRRAVHLAQPGRFLRVFVEAGPTLRVLLVRLGQHGCQVRHLLAAFAPETAVPVLSKEDAADNEVVEGLTLREVDVLALLGEPLSTKEIARRLDISPATVKRHTVNIYGKLGVNNRWDAVSRAKVLWRLHQH